MAKQGIEKLGLIQRDNYLIISTQTIYMIRVSVRIFCCKQWINSNLISLYLTKYKKKKYKKAFDCVDHNKLRKILKEMRIPDHLTCLLRNLYAGQEATWAWNWTWNNRLVPNRKRSTSRLYIVTLLIQLICRVHHEKCWTGRNTSWNQDCWEKYQ